MTDTPAAVRTHPYALGVVGVGNALAGDDGAGPAVVRRLEGLINRPNPYLFLMLDGDLFALTEILPLAPRFVFVDAITGDEPGRIVSAPLAPTAPTPSFHQADLTWTLNALKMLGVVDPFPDVEIFGITIHPPDALAEALSPPVESAVVELCEILRRRLA